MFLTIVVLILLLTDENQSLTLEKETQKQQTPQEEPEKSNEGVSGNDSNELMTPNLTETEREADFQRHKEEMQKTRRKKKRTSSSLYSSTFQGITIDRGGVV